MKKVVVTGSLAFDYIMDFPQSFEENILPDKLKTLSVSFLAHNFSKNFGGTAGNIGYNLALLNQLSTIKFHTLCHCERSLAKGGRSVAITNEIASSQAKPDPRNDNCGIRAIIIASAGENDFEPYRKHLNLVGVDTTSINEVKNEFSANMFLITDKNNCQIAGFYPGAMSKDVDLSITNDANFVVVAPTMPEAMAKFVSKAKKLGIPYLYDPAQQIPRITKEQLINGVDGAEILIGNDYELALIEKKTGWSKKEILSKSKIVITTLGEKGSLIEKGSDIFTVGIVKPQKIVDPTGAGDAYIAGFLTGYLKDIELNICGQIGATTAVYAIEQYGTQKHKFTTHEFKKRYVQTFNSFPTSFWGGGTTTPESGSILVKTGTRR